MNPLRARAQVLHALRCWFAEHGHLEVLTPVRVPCGAVEEHLYPLPSGDHVLRTSPELALKKVLATGLPRIYEIGPCLRDRERGRWHQTEFTMVEWYRVGASLSDLIDDTLALIDRAADALRVERPTWSFLTVHEAFGGEPPVGDAFFQAWVDDVEPSLPANCVVRDWPAEHAALSEVHRGTAQRFEIYLGGLELANAFLELRDADEQLRRIQEANAARVQAGEPEHAHDHAFLHAVAHLPPVAGIALGLERLTAVLAGYEDLQCFSL